MTIKRAAGIAILAAFAIATVTALVYIGGWVVLPIIGIAIGIVVALFIGITWTLEN